MNSLAYLVPRIWELLPNLKRLESVEAFKSKIEFGYLKIAHAEFVNRISTKWALYKYISKGFYLFIRLFIYLIYFHQVIGQLT